MECAIPEAAAGPVLRCGDGKRLDLSAPRVMGILNVTPDSFSDGGDFFNPEAALAQAYALVEAGAAIIDIGGESTRPGAPPVSVEEELRRVVPVVEALAPALPVPISVDTSKPEVMQAAIAAGAGMVNDVMALRAPGALETVAGLGVPVCLMHMIGTPRTMQQAPRYGDVVTEVRRFLLDRVDACLAAGIAREQIVLDPGFGFGKTVEHNCRLLRELNRIIDTGLPVLVGMSRKSIFGRLLNQPVDRRLPGSLAAAVIAAWQGARIIRAHDVQATVEAITVTDAFATLG
ncbi:dihydropteroate synthase [Alkalilimnicola ehrlichii]|uniref:Dihydropteroate synthase n=1 Tax=Alkalilimnicola ehrlichii TaxID=351052 RepID=A0A3E0X1I4_9GAMM|nr:dihydropteroate synthase [Alkalilimnicola ehrlichii]RFA30612.1 dihydropteroate synthase [Alkalilimnicola ehrlichii]RFA38115.1 dihydropteroate synthase [Alkalilimnicola ehrlichii]